MELEEAAAILKEKLRSRTFRKAVGAKVAEAVETLLKFYECGACIGEGEARRLINDYYIFESRVARLLQLYDRLSKGGLRALAREVLGDDVYLAPVEYDELRKELDIYGKTLLGVAGRVLKCYSSTNSRA
ncbi:MAG: hypothetical protein QXK71_04750 [Pyrobaculum sp.]